MCCLLASLVINFNEESSSDSTFRPEIFTYEKFNIRFLHSACKTVKSSWDCVRPFSILHYSQVNGVWSSSYMVKNHLIVVAARYFYLHEKPLMCFLSSTVNNHNRLDTISYLFWCDFCAYFENIVACVYAAYFFVFNFSLLNGYLPNNIKSSWRFLNSIAIWK